MSYRQSNYDPLLDQPPGRPLRPFNAVQRLGVVLEVVGLGIFLIHIAGRIGWVRLPSDLFDLSGMMLAIAGAALINSRRAPATPITPEQRARNKRVLVITLAICVAIIGAAFVIEYQGAL